MILMEKHIRDQAFKTRIGRTSYISVGGLKRARIGGNSGKEQGDVLAKHKQTGVRHHHKRQEPPNALLKPHVAPH
jgi:hypothetical protein